MSVGHTITAALHDRGHLPTNSSIENALEYFAQLDAAVLQSPMAKFG